MHLNKPCSKCDLGVKFFQGHEEPQVTVGKKAKCFPSTSDEAELHSR